MPLLRVQTNQALATAEAESDFLRAASQALAAMTGKPEGYCMVLLDTARPMVLGGSDEPTAFAELSSLGLPTEATAELASQLCALLEEWLAVPPRRVYSHFADVPRHLWGNNGTTFG